MIGRHGRSVWLACAIAAFAPTGAAQPPQPAPAAPAAAPAEAPSPWRRWIDPQVGTVATRYRFVENGAGITTANQQQYKSTLRVRFGIDVERHYSVVLGGSTGAGFTPSWNATGLGTGEPSFDFRIRQLFLTASPARGVEIQLGSLYVQRGETTEIIGYDNDGYVTGERLVLRMPARLFLDEIVVTSGFIGDPRKPDVFTRTDRIRDWDYGQVLMTRRVRPGVTVTGEYSVLSGQHVVRAAGTVRTRRLRLVDQLRFEQYVRLDDAAYGFDAEALRTLASRVTVAAGLADVDPFAGGLNSDRFGPGRRVYGSVSARIASELTFQAWVGRAVGDSRNLPLKTRFDAVLEYDLLQALTRHGVIR